MDKINEIEKLQKLDWFIEVVRNKAGDSFGELALQQDDPEKRIRSATILCLSECYFAVLGRTEYEKVLKRIEQKDTNNILDFFQGLPFLNHWTKTQI